MEPAGGRARDDPGADPLRHGRGQRGTAHRPGDHRARTGRGPDGGAGDLDAALAGGGDPRGAAGVGPGGLRRPGAKAARRRGVRG
ncbi:hypothetical protein ACFFX0_13020 [Citricoccus parietis]|uniref:Uncharacterized protein n=1 Tax=Citricoccus parietis TaxID=592307 RepID=A0ABV5FZF6_9MICC